jgi:hypothetical protein
VTLTKAHPIAACLALLLCASAAVAQTLQEADKVLLPVTPGRITGAFGSEWQTDVVITNLSDRSIDAGGYFPRSGCEVLCFTPPIPPHATILAYDAPRSPEVQGGFLFVERGRTNDLSLTLRTRDLSRGHETWGTVVPVVRPADLRAATFGMTDIPIGTEFRALLRVYDADARTAPRARLRVYGVDAARDYPDSAAPDPLLLDRELVFSVPSDDNKQLFYPGYVEVPLWVEPALRNATRVRVEIQPLTDERDYWGFVSVTHNETQHVTVIQP